MIRGGLCHLMSPWVLHDLRAFDQPGISRPAGARGRYGSVDAQVRRSDHLLTCVALIRGRARRESRTSGGAGAREGRLGLGAGLGGGKRPRHGKGFPSGAVREGIHARAGARARDGKIRIRSRIRIRSWEENQP